MEQTLGRQPVEFDRCHTRIGGRGDVAASAERSGGRMTPEPLFSAQDTLAAVEHAVELDQWDDALALLDADLMVAAGSRGLELRAQAAYGAGDPEGSIGSWEDLYRLHLDAGD